MMRGVSPTSAEPGASALLERLMTAQLMLLRVVEEVAPRPSFDEVFDFYRDSGFLYAAKRSELERDMETIADTWQRLLRDERTVFRIVCRRELAGGDLVVKNAICAYRYTSGTWQTQHLVSRDRHEYTGTLAVLIELIRWFIHSGVQYTRLSFRPNNPAANALFGGMAARLPADLVHLRVSDYGTVGASELRLDEPAPPGVVVRSIGPDESDAAIDFYRALLHPVELASLELRDPDLIALGQAYGQAGLERARTVLAALDADGRVLGACLAHRASLGMNFSFLENAVEHLRVRADLPATLRRRVWFALARSAASLMLRPGGRLVVMTDPRDRDLAIAAGLVAPDPKQYAVVTGPRDEFQPTIDYFADHYRPLLGAATS